mmetsp:Transcript_7943/g.19710  ORF Transcript_7943/g.19710 Transcript_7943/m.19710 type:complete len:209 (-) Transcript_7943:127-753(-)
MPAGARACGRRRHHLCRLLPVQRGTVHVRLLLPHVHLAGAGPRAEGDRRVAHHPGCRVIHHFHRGVHARTEEARSDHDNRAGADAGRRGAGAHRVGARRAVDHGGGGAVRGGHTSVHARGAYPAHAVRAGQQAGVGDGAGQRGERGGAHLRPPPPRPAVRQEYYRMLRSGWRDSGSGSGGGAGAPRYGLESHRRPAAETLTRQWRRRR